MTQLKWHKQEFKNKVSKPCTKVHITALMLHDTHMLLRNFTSESYLFSSNPGILF